ncbi:hypothetical protein CKO44_01110 [Rubrivivax gelatinosus]|uniref:Lipoprotein n=1 Tax=Rubrivivax gelatinosus TaxID=28068 RepID=A0ABS1DN17_RUBGE|nr:hypothetical protein [Rubrivivax gelatinosus]MBK1612070.1 hypothetical protein [Rubrivivax gelatinosus]MBK1711369.1 hypothetical protein [Rubrivivax gelatinosus]
MTHPTLRRTPALIVLAAAAAFTLAACDRRGNEPPQPTTETAPAAPAPTMPSTTTGTGSTGTMGATGSDSTAGSAMDPASAASR